MTQETAMSAVAKIEPSQVVTTDANSLMEVISRAASDPSTDVDKLERLMGLYERITDRKAEAEFSAAMNAAQTEMGQISADATNPQTHSKYATYAKLDAALRPIYTRHGFALSFDTGDGAPVDHVRVVAIISHVGGHSKRPHLDMPADGKGAKGGDVMTKTHATGAAMSYGSRYLLKMIFNIAIGEEDKDGNKPDEKGPISEERRAWLHTLIDETNTDIAKFCIFMKVGSLKDIQSADYAKAVKALEAKRGRA